jgi:hypothetical protein
VNAPPAGTQVSYTQIGLKFQSHRKKLILATKSALVNAPPAEREASGSPLEGSEDNYLDHLKPKSPAQTGVTYNF